MRLLDAATLRQWQLERRNFVLVDTLPEAVFLKAHLSGAINIRSDDILDQAAEFLPQKDRVIVVYCGSLTCKRAGLSAERLLSLGYTNIFKFAGGKRAWREAGFPMVGTEIYYAG